VEKIACQQKAVKLSEQLIEDLRRPHIQWRSQESEGAISPKK